MSEEYTNIDSELPKGWEWVRLGDVAKKISKKVLPKEYPNANFIGMDCIEPHTLKPKFVYKFNEFKSSGNYFEIGQVLYGRMRPYLNKVYRTEYEGACSGEFIVLLCDKNLDPDLLKYILHSKEFVSYATHKTSGDRPRISYEDIEDYPIFLPPLTEQQAIVSKIEELLSDLENGIQQLQTAQQQLKTYRQSLLKWAFEGKLTNKNVKEGELPEGWKWVKLGDNIQQPKYGTSKKCDYSYSGKAVLRIPNISNGHIDNSDLKYAVFDKKEIETYNIQEGDLLTIRSNGSIDLVGKSALIQKKDEDCLFAGYLIRLRPLFDKINSKYLLYCLSSINLRNQIELKAKSTSGVNNINSEELKSLMIPLSPIAEQQLIVQELESKLTVCDKLEETINQSLEEAETLRQSILKKAFEGKLV